MEETEMKIKEMPTQLFANLPSHMNSIKSWEKYRESLKRMPGPHMMSNTYFAQALLTSFLRTT